MRPSSITKVPIILWKDIPGFLKRGLSDRASRDFCALECLANDPHYAKPDSLKFFLLWEAKNNPDLIKPAHITGLEEKHPWVYHLFFGDGVVRFPFNAWDADKADSLSWESISSSLNNDPRYERMRLLPRWSTASRSCLVLVPEKVESLEFAILERLPERMTEEEKKGQEIARDNKLSENFGSKRMPPAVEKDEKLFINHPEWSCRETNRFYTVVEDPGKATKSAEISLRPDLTGPDRFKVPPGRYRLYSIKTGVNYVGSMNETSTKSHLGPETSLAMSRSEAIESRLINDPTFGIQTEVLTITAPMRDPNHDGKEIRDGFQVRDLTCMRPGLSYIPGQAIPYAQGFVSEPDIELDLGRSGEPKPLTDTPMDRQCKFWSKNFAVPLGRAKARLFLNWGLIHLSANAQNFLLGFNGSKLEQFVVRDVGDTSWHDNYIKSYFPSDTTVYKEFCKELNESLPTDHPKGEFLLLENNSDTFNPPPRMVRVAAFAVLKHGFAEALITICKWTPTNVYSFATGILDGFRDFIAEVFSSEERYPVGPPALGTLEVEKAAIIRYGNDGEYPYGRIKGGQEKQTYKDLVGKVSGGEFTPSALLNQAARIRYRGTQAVAGNECENFGCVRWPDDNKNNLDLISLLINAEEILLCARFEKLLKSGEFNTRLVDAISNAKWPRIVK